jgi:phospholipid N-methyltransferase
VSGIAFAQATVIVELGMGTGCVTREILRRMRADARLISLEINPTFVEGAKRIEDPRFTLRQACATALPEILAEEGIGGVDAVVSSLPLSIMDDSVVDRILDVARDSLAPDGVFLQYQYSLSQRHRMIHRYDDIKVGFAAFNLPPAFVYLCSRKQAEPGQAAKIRPALGAYYGRALASVATLVRALHD